MEGEPSTNALSIDGIQPTEENHPNWGRPFLALKMVSQLNATAIPLISPNLKPTIPDDRQ